MCALHEFIYLRGLHKDESSSEIVNFDIFFIFSLPIWLHLISSSPLQWNNTHIEVGFFFLYESSLCWSNIHCNHFSMFYCMLSCYSFNLLSGLILEIFIQQNISTWLKLMNSKSNYPRSFDNRLETALYYSILDLGI